MRLPGWRGPWRYPMANIELTAYLLVICKYNMKGDILDLRKRGERVPRIHCVSMLRTNLISDHNRNNWNLIGSKLSSLSHPDLWNPVRSDLLMFLKSGNNAFESITVLRLSSFVFHTTAVPTHPVIGQHYLSEQFIHSHSSGWFRVRS